MVLSMYYKTNKFPSSNFSKANIKNHAQDAVANFTIFWVESTQLADPQFRNTEYTLTYCNLQIEYFQSWCILMTCFSHCPLNLNTQIPMSVSSALDKWVPVIMAWSVLRLRMEELPPIWREATNILNKQSRTTDKGWSSRLGVGRGAKNSSQ